MIDELYKICSEIEKASARIAGIESVMSDYWLVQLEDWAQEDGQARQMFKWIKNRYQIKDDFFDCLAQEKLMYIALFVHLHRNDI